MKMEIFLMGVQSKGRPWFTVRYHPESCCSKYGDLLIKKFMKLSNHWTNDITKRSLTKYQ